ncbi:hypothetical protein E2C01_026304 [Portunus trituberculatus]|uniref:Reverse transcriptase domain-containing protein n=1 Tax=Portunus trituberculatus TaxID=210409 RepID=A0A5B7EIE6_PORTR|nr:hypothetical protein [Portunus trituberculatus]
MGPDGVSGCKRSIVRTSLGNVYKLIKGRESIQRRKDKKIMCMKFTKFLLKNSRRTGEQRWTDGHCIYLYIKKVFDKIRHSRLLWKLENIGGLRGIMSDWIRDYLKDMQRD